MYSTTNTTTTISTTGADADADADASHDRLTTTGTALAAPVVTPDRVAEFPLRDDVSRHEYLVRIPADRLDPTIAAGRSVRVDGEAGWTVPGRSWLHEASRTVVTALTVEVDDLALVA